MIRYFTSGLRKKLGTKIGKADVNCLYEHNNIVQRCYSIQVLLKKVTKKEDLYFLW